ncbi:MAG: tRNA uridine-5-carboxymethylaminomethyl(34) synthesis GTPase MnmE [bacterium]
MIAEETIAAIATSPGEAAIAVVRMSGPEAIAIADQIFRGSILPSAAKDRSVLFGDVVNEEGNVIDEVLLVVMRAPRSVTGEDVVEISCHGGLVAPHRILKRLLDKGCRLAEPGEFTKRAFLNGKIDLTQAEAVCEIVRARNERAFDLAMGQMKGRLSLRIAAIEGAIMDCLAPIEAEIDFPEDEVEAADIGEVRESIRRIESDLLGLIGMYEKSCYIRYGMNVAIVGRSNVGKSSLFNRILGEERVIVSPEPCTTRDVVEAGVRLNGVILNLFDTAGLSEASSAVDKEAVRRSMACLERCDIAIAVVDASEGICGGDYEVLEKAKGKRHVIVANKIDLGEDKSLDNLGSVLRVSALTGAGIPELEDALVKIAHSVGLSDLEFLVNERHARFLKSALEHLLQARDGIDSSMPLDFIASDIRMALEELHKITGRQFSEELLDEIFTRFCIGK